MSVDNSIIGLVLAAGEGTRLRPLTLVAPKPLIPFRGRPIISYILENIESASISRICVNAYYKHDVLNAWLGQNAAQISVSVEEVLLGSGGGVRRMAALLPQANHYLYHNGDILTDARLDDLISTHLASEAEVTMLVVSPEAADGNVGFSPSTGRITRLPAHGGVAEQPAQDAERVSFGGIMLFKRSIIERLPAEIQTPCIIRDAISPALQEGAKIIGLKHAGKWSDLGTHERWIDGLKQYSSPPFADEYLTGLVAPVEISDGKDSVRFLPKR